MAVIKTVTFPDDPLAYGHISAAGEPVEEL